jgi:hypothetical protein
MAVAAASSVGRLGFAKKGRKEREGGARGLYREGSAGIEREYPIFVEIGSGFGSSYLYMKNSPTRAQR